MWRLYFHTEFLKQTVVLLNQRLTSQSLTLNSHVAVDVPIQVETTVHDLDQGTGEEVVGVPLSSFGRRHLREGHTEHKQHALRILPRSHLPEEML